MGSALARAVFLDRDGVLNRCEVRNGKPYAPRRARDFRLLPGAAAAVGMLKAAGFMIVVVTNQPDIGNGIVELAEVEAMHDRLRAKLPIDHIMMCPHAQAEGCACRKPKPGMLLEAAARWGISLKDSVMIGDRWSDVVAGRGGECYTIFIDRRYKETPQIHADAVSKNLAHAVRHLLTIHDKSNFDARS